LEKEKLNDLTKFGKIDGVFHLAAKKSANESNYEPNLYWKVNLQGTQEIINFCIKNQIKNIVFTSSAAVYGSIDLERAILETDTKNPVSIYGETKLAAELELYEASVSSQISVAVLRLFNLAGCINTNYLERNGENIFSKMENAQDHGRSFAIFGDQHSTKDGTAVRDYVNVNDASLAHILAMSHLETGTGNQFVCSNIASGIGISVAEIVSLASESFMKGFSFHIEKARMGDPSYSVGDNSSAWQNFGWKPQIPFAQSFSEMFS
jgi:UDP-glucose 4-epimerase